MKFYIKYIHHVELRSYLKRTESDASDLTQNVNEAISFKSILDAENYLIKHNYRSKHFKHDDFKIMSEIEVVIDQL